MENILMRIKLEDTQVATDVCFIFYLKIFKELD